MNGKNNIPQYRKPRVIQQVSENSQRADLLAKSKVMSPLSSEPSNNTVQRVNANSMDMTLTKDTGILAQTNPNRAYLFIQNKSALPIYINYGAAANVGTEGQGILIEAGGYHEPNSVPINAIYGSCPTGEAKIVFIEGMQ